MSKFNKEAYDNYLASKEANENKVKEARAFMSRHKLSWFEDEAQKIMEDMPSGMSPVELTSSSHWVDRHGLSKAGCIPVPVGLNEVEQAVVDGMWAFLGYEPQEGIMPLLGHANAAAAFAAVNTEPPTAPAPIAVRAAAALAAVNTDTPVAVPPRFVRAVAALARSERLFAASRAPATPPAAPPSM